MDAAANYSYNYSFIDQSMQGDAKRLEGFLFPDTYEFYQGMQASSAINKFLENFHDRITAEMLEKADERGMTMQEITVCLHIPLSTVKTRMRKAKALLKEQLEAIGYDG